ncbi:MAG TPA: NF038129 family PEP-CTERM protein [Lacunisphaera sp.]
MNPSIPMKITLRAIVLFAALIVTVAAKADSSFSVSLDTSTLIGNPAGPYALDFQLNDGAGVGDGNNTATLSNFQFGGGSASGSPTWFGGASGSLASGVTLSDTSPFNEFYQLFVPGAWLSFSVHLSTNFIPGGTPDLFSFAILDGNLLNLATQSLGSDTFLEANIDSATPAVTTFASADGSIGAPRVPETLNCGLWAGGLMLLGAIARRRCHVS